MKKSTRKKWKILFWVVFVAGCAWVAFVPPHIPSTSYGVTVKVQRPPETELEPKPQEKPETPPLAGGEETTQLPPPAVMTPPSVTVPVTPEAEGALLKGKKPKIALVIDDVGVDMKGSERAIKLPPFVTLSFLPYAIRLREQAKQAHDAGHELLLHMPMEPVGHEDPGPGALLVDLPMRDLQQRFETALASFTGFDGVNNHMGSKFTAYNDGMSMVVDELQQRHLYFLDSRTSANSVGKAIAEQKGLPSIGRDVFLDDIQTDEALRAQLDATEHIARHKGYAVAIGHPHAVTMDVLATWIGEAQKAGFDFVPLNNLVYKK